MRTWLVNGTNASPHTTQSRGAVGASGANCKLYRNFAVVDGTATKPSASIRMMISGSALVICAAAEVPSPSHAPSVYGGTSSSCAGN